MGCGCGKKKPTRLRPMIFGEDEGGEPQEVIASVSVGGLPVNQRTWVRGSHVAAMLAAGWIRLA